MKASLPAVACIAVIVAAVRCPIDPDAKTIPPDSVPDSIAHTFGEITSRWVDAQRGWSWSRPVVVGDLAIFATGDRRLVARNTATGAQRWSTEVTSVDGVGFIQGLNLVARSGVVVAAISRNTVGVEVSSGRELWSYEAPPDTLVDPEGVPGPVAGVELDADDSTVFIPAWGASVSAVDLQTGQPRWVWRSSTDTQFRLGGKGVRLSGDTLFATVWHDLNQQRTSTEGWLLAIDRRDGRELARTILPAYTSGGFLNGRPEVWGNLVIVTGAAGRVWAVDRATLAIAWQYQPVEAATTTVTGPELYGDIIYTDGGDRHIVALRATDGSVVWRTRIITQATKGLLATEARLYVPESGFLNIIDRLTGRYVARTEQPGATYISGSLFATPAAASGTQIFITIDKGAWSFDEP